MSDTPIAPSLLTILPSITLPDGLIPARITAQYRDRYEAVIPSGPVFARCRRSSYRDAAPHDYPTVGDLVALRYVSDGDSLICQTLPRQSYFVRRAAGPVAVRQAAAANFDYVFLLASCNRDFRVPRLERYLAQAHVSGGAPIILLTKTDLTDDPAPYIAQARAVAGDVPVHAVSAVTGGGLDALSPYLAPGKLLVLLGSSGVGKSSLVNALLGRQAMAVSAIREDDARGRHTTTHRQLIPLPGGAAIIDTPGMRELGPWDAEEGVGETFRDIEELIADCHFRNCTHTREPGCALRDAVERGLLSPQRPKSYLALRMESRRGSGKTHSKHGKGMRRQKEAKNTHWEDELR